MATDKRFASHADLGQWWMEKHPEDPALRRMDPAEIGRQLLPQLAPQGFTVVDEWGKVSLGETARNFPGDVWETGKENVEGIWHGLTNLSETAGQLGDLAMGGIAELGDDASRRQRPYLGAPMLQTLGRGLEYTGLADDENRAMARGFRDLYEQSFEPGQVEKRPANALANVMDVLPVGPNALTKGKLLRTLGTLTPSRMMLPRNVGAGVQSIIGGARDRLTRSASEEGGRLNRMRQQMQQFRDMNRVGGRTIRHDIGSTMFGITTGRPAEFISQLLRRSKGDTPKLGRNFRRFFVAARQMGRGELAGRLQRRTFEAMNRLQEKMQSAYRSGTEEVFGTLDEAGRRTGGLDEVPNLPMDRLREDITQAMASIGVQVGPDGKLLFDESFVTPLGGARETLRKTVEPLFNPERPAGAGKPTLGLHSDAISASELHRQRQLVDDALSTLSADSDVSTRARHGLRAVREATATYLEDALGEKYVTAMEDYHIASILMDELQTNLRVNPGQITRRGQVVGGSQEPAMRAMEGAIGDTGLSARRLDAIELLEDITDTKGLVDMQLAQMAQAWAGGGLIVRNELAQLGREILKPVGALMAGGAAVGGVAAGVTGAVTGGLAVLPAVALFSPRLMSSLIVGRGELGGIRQAVKRSLSDKSKQRIERIAQAMQRLDEMTGGDLRRLAQREGWNVTQLMERLDVQQESQTPVYSQQQQRQRETLQALTGGRGGDIPSEPE